jgi:hypothetical protein
MNFNMPEIRKELLAVEPEIAKATQSGEENCNIKNPQPN